MLYYLWTRTRHFLRRALLMLVCFSAVGLVLGPEWPAFQRPADQIRAIVATQEFDFLVYELDVLALKGEAALVEGDGYLDEASRKQIVLDFVALIGQISRLEGQINLIFTDPAITDPAAASAELQEELAEARAAAERIQPIAEATLEEQVAAVLADEGFAILDNVWPPVQAHVTPLPYVLIVSPRNAIQVDHNFALAAGLPVSEQERIENDVYADVDMSALIVPIGGLGIFPSMVLERADLAWLANTFAHEWAHHWLSLQPLGIRYGSTPEMRTINETVASILGDTVGTLVIERYYPELVPPPPAPAAPPAEEDDGSTSPPPSFNFREEMRLTRLEVDRLLALGQIDEAEAYMAAQRQIFWDNGYRIRKLNQAYFAFYGSYADAAGARGEDPIGPTILSVWQKSDSLAQFMRQMGQVTSFADVQTLEQALP